MKLEDQIEQDLQNTFGDEGAHTLRETIAKVDKSWVAPATVKAAATPRQAKLRRLPFRRVLSLAASILLLAVAGWWVLDLGQPSDPNALYTQYAEAYKVSLTARGASDVAGLDAAQAAYQSGDYATAYAAFSALVEQDPDDAQYAFYAGVSAMLTGQADLAIPLFKNLLAQPNHLFVEQARWYLALSYLQEGNSAFAKTYLEAIDVGAFKFKEAGDIMGKLGD